MQVTFTMSIKEELAGISSSSPEALAETSAFLRVAADYNLKEIIFTSEHEIIYDRYKNFLEERYNIYLEKEGLTNKAFNKNLIYRCEIKEKVPYILDSLAIYKDEKKLSKPSEDFLGDDSLKAAYLRGAFIGKGVVSDPKTSRYHLEITVDKKGDAVYIQRLLNYFNLNSRIIKRENKYMVYIKEADKISDFLKLVGAYKAVLYYENIRVYREEKNKANRLNNMEQANLEKAMSSALKQLEDIELIERELGLEFLDERCLEAANYRIKHPEYSLLELTLEMSKDGINITKSGLNHRYRKISGMAERIRKRIKRASKEK